MTVKVEQDREGFFVEVVFREPFEHFFEIARHNVRFKTRRGAENLAARVKEKIREIGLSKSLSYALNETYWEYVSSAYDGRMNYKIKRVFVDK